MLPQDDVRYFSRRYWDHFWFLRFPKTPWLKSSLRVTFPILLLVLAALAVGRWGRTSHLETTQLARASPESVRNLSNLSITSSGSLMAMRQDKWSVALETWQAGISSPPVTTTLDLDELTPKVTSINTPALVVVPNLVGQSFERTGSYLAAVGLSLGTIQFVGEHPGNVLREGVVQSQSPAPGTRVKAGTRVHLIVAPGRETFSRDPMKGPYSQNAIEQTQIIDSVQPQVSAQRPPSRTESAQGNPAGGAPTARTDRPLATTLNPSGTQIAWAWNGHLYFHLLSSTASTGKRPVEWLPLSAPAQVIRVAMTNDGLAAVQYANGVFELYDTHLKKLILNRTLISACNLVSSDRFLAYSCPEEHTASVFGLSQPAAVDERGYALKEKALLGIPALSTLGHLAFPTDAGTVHLYDAPDGGYAELTAPGLPQSVAFYDESHVLVGGSFNGIHLLSTAGPGQNLLPEVKDTRALATRQSHVAYIAQDGPGSFELNQAQRISRNGIVLLATAGLLLLLYFVVPLFRVYSEEAFQVQEHRIRQSITLPSALFYLWRRGRFATSAPRTARGARHGMRPRKLRSLSRRRCERLRWLSDLANVRSAVCLRESQKSKESHPISPELSKRRATKASRT
jgi:hypothetical protein